MPESTNIELLLDIHLIATLFMTGLIWFVQVVHYPLFAKVGADGYMMYQDAHMTRTTWVVAPVMLLEAASASAIVLLPGINGKLLPLVGLMLLVVVWVSTAVLQVPCHQRLQRGFDDAAVRRLVASNWIRTMAWSARSLVALSLARWSVT